MRHLRATALVLAFVVGVPAAASAGAPGVARTARPKSPYKPGLAPLPRHHLLSFNARTLLDERAYKDISAATQHLLAKYPPETHYFVGLGRDPAPVIAFLQNLGGKDLAVNFPASSNNSDSVTAETMARYVDRFIPTEIFDSGRTIVFVDATSTGRGLDHYVPLIAPSLRGARYLKAAYGARPGSAIYLRPGDKQVIDTTPFPEVDKFFTTPYENTVSEYPRHVPGSDAIETLDVPRPEYQQFRNALMQRMQRDEALDTFLTRPTEP